LLPKPALSRRFPLSRRGHRRRPPPKPLAVPPPQRRLPTASR
jgi:hypothetical protein